MWPMPTVTICLPAIRGSNSVQEMNLLHCPVAHCRITIVRILKKLWTLQPKPSPPGWKPVSPTSICKALICRMCLCGLFGRFSATRTTPMCPPHASAMANWWQPSLTLLSMASIHICNYTTTGWWLPMALSNRCRGWTHPSPMAHLWYLAPAIWWNLMRYGIMRWCS